jgi:hypothetical protein
MNPVIRTPFVLNKVANKGPDCESLLGVVDANISVTPVIILRIYVDISVNYTKELSKDLPVAHFRKTISGSNISINFSPISVEKS